ncbi:MAG: aminopeptidase P family protein [Bacteroidales bacterium]|nr:aminopeptidase P family protein [Bacteroidales bacterium]
MAKITKQEFSERILKIQEVLSQRGIDGLMVYGDEYRKENLRYVSNFWPIFERGACFIPKKGNPILACAPEGEKYAKEMNVWDDVRNVKEFACVTVPEEINYPMAKFSSFGEIIKETLKGGKNLGFTGIWDISHPLYNRIENAVSGVKMINADDILINLRIIKSELEIECLKEAGRIACAGYRKLIEVCKPGLTELMVAGQAEGEARSNGAEGITFHVFGSGKRADTIIGRPVNKIINDGDMIMSALAVQYEGYTATVEFPFVAGKMSENQKKMLNILFEAANVQQKYLSNGVTAGEMVKAVKGVFKKYSAGEYDVYPPMHGIGLAEAESPYPDADSIYSFKSGMCVNSDISLFGHPGGSNRIEEGFVITEKGPVSITPYIRELCEKGI